MGLQPYKADYILHSTKGSAWKDHKYISKFFKNGKWFYVYKNGLGNSKDDSGHTAKDTEYETKEYIKGENGKMVHYTEKTRNGSSWLSKKELEVRSGNQVTIYKSKGKIAQGIEKFAASGKTFIESLSKKKKKG